MLVLRLNLLCNYELQQLILPHEGPYLSLICQCIPELCGADTLHQATLSLKFEAYSSLEAPTGRVLPSTTDVDFPALCASIWGCHLLWIEQHLTTYVEELLSSSCCALVPQAAPSPRSMGACWQRCYCCSALPATSCTYTRAEGF